ncbi:MAG: tetratricopeptide repeat protein [Proteobacteria bacterium]|nr:tetratricopeptide repeat protein [Pseudomonadota bacterium]
MNAILNRPFSHPWLEQFRADPATQLDDLLRGLAWIPPYERATPSEILKRLFGGLQRDDTDLNLLDENLRGWLETRWMQWNAEQREAYGLPRFVTELTDALSVIWLLELPVSGAWLQANYFELSRRAAPLRLSKFWDLPRALAQAAALTQIDQRLRLYWLQLCGDAALASRRVLIDAALSGLANLPDAKGHGASPELIAGLARFGAGLDANPRNQADFLRRWRSLKVRFPRTPGTWHKLWHGALDDNRYQDRPFRQWLLESDAYLARTWTGGASLQIPHNIPDIIRDLGRRARQDGQRPAVLDEAIKLLNLLERYAEATGDAYFLVRSACNLGKELVAWIPGHVLAWSRVALRWESSNGQAWDMRGRALLRLGRDDLAEAVYWEAVRRLPADPVVRNQLALLLQTQDRNKEAEALFREALTIEAKNGVVLVELAHLLYRTGREEEAETLLRDSIEDEELRKNPILLYTFASLLIAWNRPIEAAAMREDYVRDFGQDHWARRLDRLLVKGAAGADEKRQHLALRHPNEEDAVSPIAEDGIIAERQTEVEQSGGESLRRSATAGRADLLFRRDHKNDAEDALAGLLRADDDDVYARVVWALHEPEQRPDLARRYREQLGILAPHLAAAGADTPAALWLRLLEEFPERQPLIDFTRLLRHGPDESATERLQDWLEKPEQDDEAYLQKGLRLALSADESIDPQSPDLRNLLNAAIRREVELPESGLLQAVA